MHVLFSISFIITRFKAQEGTWMLSLRRKRGKIYEKTNSVPLCVVGSNMQRIIAADSYFT